MAKRYKNYMNEELKTPKKAEEPKPIKPPQVKVIVPNLRKRRSPSEKAEIIGYITDQGIYQLQKIQDGWGQLEDGTWIMLSFTEKI